MMVCPLCAQERGAVALRAYQLDPLRKVAAGQAELTVRPVDGKRHVQMFGAERVFCGLPVSPQHRRSRIAWTEDELNKICAGCRIELRRAMEEAQNQCPPSG